MIFFVASLSSQSRVGATSHHNTNNTTQHNTSHHITSHHITSHHITTQQNTTQHITSHHTGPPSRLDAVHVGRFSATDTWAEQLVRSLVERGLAATTDVDGEADSNMWVGTVATAPRGSQRTTSSKGQLLGRWRSVRVAVSVLDNATAADQLMELARRGGTSHPLVYDRVIRCLGWRHDRSLYTNGTNAEPMMQYNGKYAIMTSEYESVNVPGMYFAGGLAHGKDHLRSAGGFIHGFRYTARALFRMLESKYHTGGVWPATVRFADVHIWDGSVEATYLPNGCNRADWTVSGPPADGCVAVASSNSSGGGGNAPQSADEPRPDVVSVATGPTATPFELLVDKTLTRINVASGPYQMVSVLGDGIVFTCADGDGLSGHSDGDGDGGADGPADERNKANLPSVAAEYLEEVPIEYFNRRFAGRPRVAWHFGYQNQRQSLHESRSTGTLFQIHLWWYPGDACGCDGDGGHGCDTARGRTSGSYPKEPVVKEVLRLGEDLNTNWGAYETRQRVGEWIYTKIAELRTTRAASAVAAAAVVDAGAAVPGAVAPVEPPEQPNERLGDVGLTKEERKEDLIEPTNEAKQVFAELTRRDRAVQVSDVFLT
jgi:hypothetical protein